MNSYIFILCPPFSGSTVLWKLIATSENVSALPEEGQMLPEVKGILRHETWNPRLERDWKHIKSVWRSYWDLSKPLLVEKSPPHLMRAETIAAHFDPVYFLIMVRNPYAHCEGLIRRGRSAHEAAVFAARCLEQQRVNAETLTRSLAFTYEDMIADPESLCSTMQQFIPQLGPLKPDQKFTVHSIDGVVKRKITDLNPKKIKNLSVRELRQINGVLDAYGDTMDYWGYRYYHPSVAHFMAFIRQRAQLTLNHKWNKLRSLRSRL